MPAFPAPACGLAHDNQLVLRAAVSAYLGRYRGETRLHTESDLHVFVHWCTDQDLDPLTVVRADVERYLRWPPDVRRYQPSTVSRRLSVLVGFYRVPGASCRGPATGGAVCRARRDPGLPPRAAGGADRCDGPVLRPSGAA